MPAQIKIIIKPDGSIATSVEGVAGLSCKELSGWLSQIGQTVEEGLTPEAYQAPDVQVTDAWVEGGG